MLCDSGKGVKIYRKKRCNGMENEVGKVGRKDEEKRYILYYSGD